MVDRRGRLPEDEEETYGCIIGMFSGMGNAAVRLARYIVAGNEKKALEEAQNIRDMSERGMEETGSWMGKRRNERRRGKRR